jgi:hypothetical protein
MVTKLFLSDISADLTLSLVLEYSRRVALAVDVANVMASGICISMVGEN